MSDKPQSMTDAAEMLWVVLANVSGGDWTKQTADWQEAAARWRDNYFRSLEAALRAPAVPPDLAELMNEGRWQEAALLLVVKVYALYKELDAAGDAWRTAAFLKDRTRRAIRERVAAGDSVQAVADDYAIPVEFVNALVAWQLFGDAAPPAPAPEADQT